MPFVNGVKMMFGLGEIQLGIAGEYIMTFCRIRFLGIINNQTLGSYYIYCQRSSASLEIYGTLWFWRS